MIEGSGHEGFDPRKKLDSLMHLAELCIEVIQQNEEYHAEVSNCAFVAETGCSDLLQTAAGCCDRLQQREI